MPAFLDVRGVSKRFGGLQAVKDVSLGIEKGQTTCLIGPNGAGKTTLFNLITGYISVDSGSVTLDGRDLTGMAPHKIARSGMTRTFQLVRVFPRMTLIDNIMLGYNNLEGDTLTSSILGTVHMPQAYRKKSEEALNMLDFLGLAEYAGALASDLSYGQQKLLEIGRALSSQPKVLLLDEPLAGLNVKMINRVIEIIGEIREQGHTMVVIEHNMAAVLEMSDAVHVLNFGEVLASGTPKEVLENDKVVDSYLGGKK